LGYKVACIRLLDPRTNKLEIIAVSGISKGRFNKLRGKSIDYLMLKPFFSERYKIGHSYLIPHENHEWQEFARKHFNIPRQTLQKKSGWRAYDALATPLTDQSDNLIGLLTLDVPNTGTLPNVQTIETIGVFTSAASWMIELYRFQKRLIEQKQRASSFIDTISEDLAKGHNFETIGEVVVQAGAKLLSVEGCSLYIVRGKFIELTHSTYLSELGDIRRRKPISTQPKSGLTSWVAATGEVLRLDSMQLNSHSAWAGEKEHLRYLPSKTCHSLLIAPVKSKTGKVMGVITLENKKAIRGVKDFDEEDQAHLMSLASEFAKALESISRYAAIIEWERVGFEDDIHDLINWYHSGVVLWIDAINEWLKRDDIAKAKELMPGLMYHAHTTVEELKSVHANILSQALEADSLSQAFNRMIKTWKTRFKTKYDAPMKIKLNCPKDIDIPIRLRNTLIRIASLAFSNAIKHSGIIEDPNVYIQIDIARIGDLITLTVSDNGKGMENIIEGYGITRMKQLRERIKSWDGIEADIQFDAALGRGTKVILSIQIGELETS
jgi:signal transduction histidine kinase